MRTITAVDQARTEAAARKRARLSGAFDSVKGVAGKLDTSIDAVMESQVLDMARKAIAAVHRKLPASPTGADLRPDIHFL